jgi:naphtho-gamma-pyrone polyketide synthase
VELPITAPYHASHLVGVDVKNILEASDIDLIERKTHHSLISAGFGTYIEGRSAVDLLTEVIHEILYKPLDWQLLIDALSTGMSSTTASLKAIGPTNCASYILKELSLNGINATTTLKTDSKPTAVGMAPQSGDIAVVGMAGRFPGGETLESFWNVLRKGMDLHQEVMLS